MNFFAARLTSPSVRTWTSRAMLAALVSLPGIGAVGIGAGLLPGCGAFCRDVETRNLDINCEDGANRFRGEIHFDREATFRTFLSQQCMPSTPRADTDAIVESVDWGSEAVFVAVGPPNIDGTRCVELRELERAQVCSDGLKIYFSDTYRNSDFGCAGPRWTVAFVMLREDLRAALEAGDALP